MKLEKLNILLVSNEPWEGTWFSKHHYASELSKKNKVYFADPPPPWSIAHVFSNAVSFQEAGPGLSVIRYTNFLPLTARSLFLNRINSRIVGRRIKKAFAQKGIRLNLFWSFDPFRLVDPLATGASFSVYHCMDHYRAVSERECAANCDAVITVSARLRDKLRPFAKRILLAPHGISALQKAGTAADNVCLLGGTIDARTDFKLLGALASRHKDMQFRIAGPVKKNEMSRADLEELASLEKMTNVIFTGALPYPDFEREISSAKICICIYKQNTGANRLSSLKIMQYLAAGKPVVSTFLEEYSGKDFSSVIALAETHEDFLHNFERSLAGDSPEKTDSRLHLASGYTYSRILGNIEKELNTSA